MSTIRMIAGTLMMTACVTAVGAQPAPVVEAAKKEGAIATLGCPADWAGYGFVTETVQKTHGLKWSDKNMPSGDIVKQFAENTADPADMGDIGFQFAPGAAKAGLLAPYKNSQWESIPEWAKDKDGHYAAAYYGTVAFLVNKAQVPNVPKTWKDLLKPEYKGKITIQDPRVAANAQFAVIAASFANGGSEDNLDPGIKFFAELKKSGNLVTDVLPDKDTLSNGKAGIGLLWDFQGLTWRRDIKDLEVLIPSDGSTKGPYAAVINKNAKHPEAAKLFIEVILSDEGQVAFARSGAQPIRKVPLPQAISDGLLPEAQYSAAKDIKNWAGIDAIGAKIGERWTAEVLGAK